MTRRHCSLCIMWGFTLMYLALVAAGMTVVVPFLERFQRPVLLYGLLPIGITGAVLTTIGKLNEKAGWD
jgi:hypothetical protein